jgi:uncharacterized iron-regulated membrane protein
MLKAYLLKAHRWVALVFALPLLVVVFTGFVLSFEPIVSTASVKPGSVTAEQLTGLVAQYDPAGKARGLTIDPRLNVLTLQGVGADGSTDIDLASGKEVDAESALDDFFSLNRRLHRSLMLQMNWLVVASSYAMLALAGLGLFMGFSRLRNSLSGWHKGVAWFLLPLVVLSPLTGILLTVGDGGPRAAGGRARPERVPLIEATKMVAATVDPGTILSIGARGGRMLAIVARSGETSAYAISKDGVVAQPRNWSRSLHTGSGLWTGALNVLTSGAILTLLVTGVLIWSRRTLRVRANRRARAAAASPSPAE